MVGRGLYHVGVYGVVEPLPSMFLGRCVGYGSFYE